MISKMHKANDVLIIGLYVIIVIILLAIIGVCINTYQDQKKNKMCETILGKINTRILLPRNVWYESVGESNYNCCYLDVIEVDNSYVEEKICKGFKTI